MRTVPGILAADGDAWAGMDDAVGDVSAAIALWDKDINERGLGELNFPPDYPKMPGEPPRVQPSKRRKDKSDEDYMPPKAERDADLRSRVGSGGASGRPDAGQAGQGDPHGRLPLRAEVGRLPLDHLPLRRPGRDRQPQREADDALLPRGGRGGAGQLPARSASSTARSCSSAASGDRLDFDALQQRIHPAASRVKKLAAETPASFVAFDLLALGDDDLTERPFAERRALLEEALARGRSRRST